jgi:excisionase family DNA binding protein
MHKRKTTNRSEAPPLLLTIEQAAQALGVGKDLVYNFIRHEGLPAVDMSRSSSRQKLRVSVSALQIWIQNRERQQNPPNDLITNRQADAEISTSQRRSREGHAKSQRGKAPSTSKQRHSQAS